MPILITWIALAVLNMGIPIFIPDILPAFATDLTLETGSYVTCVQTLGNTVNTGLVAFYDHQVAGTPTLKSRYINEKPTLGPAKIVAAPIKQGGFKPYIVTWHAVLKIHLVVYKANDNLYARPMDAYGVPTNALRLITRYTGDHIALTWTKNKRFILFYVVRDQIWMQLLSSNGKPVKKASRLTYFSALAAPFDASTEADGTAVCYYGAFDPTVQTLKYGMLKTDHHRKLLDNFTIGGPQTSSSLDNGRYCFGSYDALSRRHALVWRVYPIPSQYTVVEEDGTAVKPLTNTPFNARPLDLALDPVDGTFSILFYSLVNAGGADHSRFYRTNFDANGLILDPQEFLKETETENDGASLSYSSIGCPFLIWVNDGLPLGVYGTYFN